MDANLYHPEFQPGTAVKVVGYNPDADLKATVAPEEPDPNGHVGIVGEWEDNLEALAAASMGLVKVDILGVPSGGDTGDWWALLPTELEVVRG